LEIELELRIVLELTLVKLG